MIKKYKSVKLKGDYYVRKLELKCKDCNKKFEMEVPIDDLIVKFKEDNGSEVRWLPTYFKNGYLKLMSKLIPDRKEFDEIDMTTFKEFQEKIKDIVELTNRGNHFIVADLSRKCPYCNSKHVLEISEKILKNPSIKWLKVDEQFLD